MQLVKIILVYQKCDIVFDAPLYCSFFFNDIELFSIQFFLFQLCNIKFVANNLFFCISFANIFMASFLYCSPYSCCSSNYCNSSLLLLKAKVIKTLLLSPKRVRKSIKEDQLKGNQLRKEAEAKQIKSDKFTKSNNVIKKNLILGPPFLFTTPRYTFRFFLTKSRR